MQVNLRSRYSYIFASYSDAPTPILTEKYAIPSKDCFLPKESYSSYWPYYSYKSYKSHRSNKSNKSSMTFLKALKVLKAINNKRCKKERADFCSRLSL